ncbi:hypothetical protein, partial [Salmonella sp. s60093]|uniref:hypothetical protein n=1 Tax=Salmonella sp. s60093 TaxID=3159721 RepID=UPI00397F3F29
TNTPDEPITPNSNTVYPFGISTSRNRALVENNSTARPNDWKTLAGVLYRSGHREMQLEYQAGDAATPLTTRVFDEIVSFGVRDLIFPRRVSD